MKKYLDIPSLSQGNSKSAKDSQKWCGRTSASMIFNYYQMVEGKANELVKNDNSKGDLYYADGTIAAKDYMNSEPLEKAKPGWERKAIFPDSNRPQISTDADVRKVLDPVIKSIDINNPVLFYSGISTSESHARHIIVISGYKDGEDGSLWLLIDDPATMKDTVDTKEKSDYLGMQNLEILDHGTWNSKGCKYWLKAKRLFEPNQHSKDKNDLWCDHGDSKGFTVFINHTPTKDSAYAHSEGSEHTQAHGDNPDHTKTITSTEKQPPASQNNIAPHVASGKREWEPCFPLEKKYRKPESYQPGSEHHLHFGAPRKSKKDPNRIHAALDFYAPPGTEIHAIEHGTITHYYDFHYNQIFAIEVDHGEYTVRYGEVEPRLKDNFADPRFTTKTKTVYVEEKDKADPEFRKGMAPHPTENRTLQPGDVVRRGQVIGYVGQLRHIEDGQWVNGSRMLHFEMYKGSVHEGLTVEGNIKNYDNVSPGHYSRHHSLIDPTKLVDKFIDLEDVDNTSHLTLEHGSNPDHKKTETSSEEPGKASHSEAAPSPAVHPPAAQKNVEPSADTGTGVWEPCFPLEKKYRKPESYQPGTEQGLYFGAERKSTKDPNRIHAALDFKAPAGTEIHAIADGKIKDIYDFHYNQIFAVEVDHVQYTVRYGEIQPDSEYRFEDPEFLHHKPKVFIDEKDMADAEFRRGMAINPDTNKPFKKTDRVKRGQVIAYVGQLRHIEKGKWVNGSRMLHFEMYKGSVKEGLTVEGNCTNYDNVPPGHYSRHHALVDPTKLVDKFIDLEDVGKSSVGSIEPEHWEYSNFSNPLGTPQPINVAALPIDLSTGIALTRDAIDDYYQHTEKDTEGGYFPVGSNTLWHGGLHIFSNEDSEVHACLPGKIVAARLSEDTETAKGPIGHCNFILVQHNIHNKKCYSLYMHLKENPLDENDEFLKKLKWPLTSKKQLKIAQGHDRNYRSKADSTDKSTIMGTLKEGEIVDVIEDSTAAPWKKIKLEDGKEAFIKVDPAVVQEIVSDPKIDSDLLAKLKKGDVVKIDKQIDGGELLWKSGTYGPADYHKGLIHWEIFSEEAIIGEDAKPENADNSNSDQGDSDSGNSGTDNPDYSPDISKPKGEKSGYTSGAALLVREITGPTTAKENDILNLYVTAVNYSDASDAALQSINWLVKSDGKEVQRFSKQGYVLQYTVPAGYNGKNLDIYAFMNSPSDKVCVKVSVSNTKTTNTESKEKKSAAASGGWIKVEDPDNDFNIDNKQITNIFGDIFSDKISSRKTVKDFYSSNPGGKVEQLRNYVCKFESEWAISDVDKTISKLKDRGIIAKKETIQPYLWWESAKSAGVELPSSSHVWHYNPISFMALLGNSQPQAQAHEASVGSTAVGEYQYTNRDGGITTERWDISDEEFVDKNALTKEEISAIISKHNKVLVEKGFDVGVYNCSQQFNLNPKVLLATLACEQGWVRNGKYDKAFGVGPEGNPQSFGEKGGMVKAAKTFVHRFSDGKKELLKGKLQPIHVNEDKKPYPATRAALGSKKTKEWQDANPKYVKYLEDGLDVVPLNAAMCAKLHYTPWIDFPPQNAHALKTWHKVFKSFGGSTEPATSASTAAPKPEPATTP